MLKKGEINKEVRKRMLYCKTVTFRKFFIAIKNKRRKDFKRMH